MRFYISATGIKRLNISSAGAGNGKGSPAPARRFSGKSTLLPVLLLLALVLPFLFVRVAFVVLESAAACSSSPDCIGWRFFSGSDASVDCVLGTRKKYSVKSNSQWISAFWGVSLREELTRALLEAKDSNPDNEVGGGGGGGGIESFNQLVQEMTLKQQDVKAFAFRTKAMLSKMEHKVQSARQRESVYWHLASHGVPKGMHCLCLKLAEEYAVNAMARSRLPSPEYVSRLSDPSFHHLVLLTDNVLAASVVVSSTVRKSANPEKLIFHIVTDKKTYTPMHAWFATNYIRSAVVEVKGLHQYDWSQEVNVGVKEILDIHRNIWRHYYKNLKERDFEYDEEHKRYLEALSPSSLSLMNLLRIYIPELFPDLNKIVFLEDDTVVQHDISSLWDLDLNGNVVGAVVNSWCGDNCCPGSKYKDYFNFSHPIISSNFDHDRCVWLYGVNVFDLEAWRRTNITETYHQWLKLSQRSGLTLWPPGVIPPALLAFEGHVHPIDPLWHVAGLGHRSPEVPLELVEAAAVIHFSGPAKPWLEIGSPEVRGLWTKHVNHSNKFIRRCKIMG